MECGAFKEQCAKRKPTATGSGSDALRYDEMAVNDFEVMNKVRFDARF